APQGVARAVRTRIEAIVQIGALLMKRLLLADFVWYMLRIDKISRTISDGRHTSFRTSAMGRLVVLSATKYTTCNCEAKNFFGDRCAAALLPAAVRLRLHKNSSDTAGRPRSDN